MGKKKNRKQSKPAEVNVEPKVELEDNLLTNSRTSSSSRSSSGDSRSSSSSREESGYSLVEDVIIENKHKINDSLQLLFRTFDDAIDDIINSMFCHEDLSGNPDRYESLVVYSTRYLLDQLDMR